MGALIGRGCCPSPSEYCLGHAQTALRSRFQLGSRRSAICGAGAGALAVIAGIQRSPVTSGSHSSLLIVGRDCC